MSVHIFLIYCVRHVLWGKSNLRVVATHGHSTSLYYIKWLEVVRWLVRHLATVPFEKKWTASHALSCIVQRKLANNFSERNRLIARSWQTLPTTPHCLPQFAAPSINSLRWQPEYQTLHTLTSGDVVVPHLEAMDGTGPAPAPLACMSPSPALPRWPGCPRPPVRALLAWTPPPPPRWGVHQGVAPNSWPGRLRQ
jgi:hypothetical protein